jgi:hypothetical protein
VNRTKLFSVTAALTVGLGSLVTGQTAQAINFGDMMNPGKWFGGGDRDRYYDDYRYGGPYGRWGGPYGYGGPYGWGGPYGYGGGPYGYGGSPWGGWGGYPGYGPGSTIVVTPQGGASRDSQPAPRLPE